MKYEELSKFKANINGVEFTDETICGVVSDEIENMEDFFEIEINDTIRIHTLFKKSRMRI